MSFSPRFQDDLLPLARLTFTDDDNNPVDVSGQNLSNFTLILDPTPKVDQPGVSRVVGAGVFTYNTNGTDGKVIYAWVQADVHVPGSYQVYAVALINSKPMTSDAIPLIINPKP